jgi:hypothetical protein
LIHGGAPRKLRDMPTFSFLQRAAAGAFAFSMLLPGCGGDVVVDAPPDDDGGPSSSGASSSSSSSGGGRTCADHLDCGPNEVCIFATGACAPICDRASCDSCGAGSVCNSCATSSCPECDDCLSACRAREATSCDDDDPCPPGQACDAASTCRTSCPNGVECNSVSEFCAECVTGSCCGCLDCVSLCMPGF